MPKKNPVVNYDPIGEMYGPRAVQAPFMMITCKQNQVHGINRTMIGGLILSDMCTTQAWERWRGIMILIPERVDVPLNKKETGTIEHMMLNWLNHPDDVHDKDHQYWRQTWKI